MIQGREPPCDDVIRRLIVSSMYHFVQRAYAAESGDLVLAPIDDYRVEVLATCDIPVHGDGEPAFGVLALCHVGDRHPGTYLGEVHRTTASLAGFITHMSERRVGFLVVEGWYLGGGSSSSAEGPPSPPPEKIEDEPIHWAAPVIHLGKGGAVLCGGQDRSGRAATLRVTFEGGHSVEGRFNDRKAAVVFAPVPEGLEMPFHDHISVLDDAGVEIAGFGNTHFMPDDVEGDPVCARPRDV